MENEQKKNVEDEIGFGNYLLKQLYQNTVAIGGSIGGALVGFLGTAPFLKDQVVSEKFAQNWSKIPLLPKIPGFKTAPKLGQFIGAGVGLIVGSLAAGITLGYGHWKKIKQAQMQVDEITKNISDIEVFKKTDPELKAENERLWNELHARDKERGAAVPVKHDVAPAQQDALHSEHAAKETPASTIQKPHAELQGKAEHVAPEMTAEAAR